MSVDGENKQFVIIIILLLFLKTLESEAELPNVRLCCYRKPLTVTIIFSLQSLMNSLL